MPPAFHELYSLLDDRDELTRGQDRVLPPAELYTDGGVLVFRHENQHVTRWRLGRLTVATRSDCCWP